MALLHFSDPLIIYAKYSIASEYMFQKAKKAIFDSQDDNVINKYHYRRLQIRPVRITQYLISNKHI